MSNNKINFLNNSQSYWSQSRVMLKMKIKTKKLKNNQIKSENLK